MTDPVEQLRALTEPWLWSGFVVFIRVGAAMMFLPAFGESTVPMRIKLTATIAFTMIVLPIVQPGMRLPDFDPLVLVMFLGTEITVGLLFGFTMRSTLFALQIAGTIIAQSVSLSQMMGVETGEPQTVISRLFTMAALALAAVADFPVYVVEALASSYDTLPAGRFPVADLAALHVARLVSEMFSLAFAFSAPFVIAAFLYNLALGIINRAMPQLMVIFIGAPAITAGGLLLLVISAPLIMDRWLTLTLETVSGPFELRP